MPSLIFLLAERPCTKTRSLFAFCFLSTSNSSFLEPDTAAALDYLVENDPFDNLLNEAVAGVVAEQGVGGFRRIFEKIRQADRGAMLATESFVNGLGYRLLGQNRLKKAIEIFKFNVEAHPKSANTYDSLVEAYLGAGEKKLAFDYYRKTLEVDPDYANAHAAARSGGDEGRALKFGQIAARVYNPLSNFSPACVRCINASPLA